MIHIKCSVLLEKYRFEMGKETCSNFKYLCGWGTVGTLWSTAENVIEDDHNTQIYRQ